MPISAPAPPIDVTPLREQLRRIELELQRRRWATDPTAWATERLHDSLWSGQRRIFEAVAKNRRTAVTTCHSVGKSFSAGTIAAWWLDIHKPGEAFVITTATTGAQVKVILWKEIGRAHARGDLKGRVNQTEWIMDVNGKEEVVAMGRKPSDYSPTAFQGIHAPKVLVIVDEANGVRGPLWNAIDSLIANDNSKILVIGNPDIPEGEFYEYCKPGSGWCVIQIGAFESPNFTGEEFPEPILRQLIGRTYVEEKRARWAPSWQWLSDGSRCIPPTGRSVEDSSLPFWQSKVLGLFPHVVGDKTLIPLEWIRRAQERTLVAVGVGELGLDVGGGGDSSTLALAQGPVVRILHEDHNPDTMQTCGLLLDTMRRIGVQHAKVDVVGIGRGIVDRAAEVKREIQNQGRAVTWIVEGVNVGEAADDVDAFENRRAELWWAVRERFERGEIDIDPLDEDLAAELASIRFERTSKGRIKIESKKEALARGVPSPNRADALMHALGKSRMPITAQAHVMPTSIGEGRSYWQGPQ